MRLLNLFCVGHGADREGTVLVSLCKGKGDTNDRCNSRDISLLCVLGKFYRRVRIRESTNGVIGEEQCGF